MAGSVTASPGWSPLGGSPGATRRSAGPSGWRPPRWAASSASMKRPWVRSHSLTSVASRRKRSPGRATTTSSRYRSTAWSGGGSPTASVRITWARSAAPGCLPPVETPGGRWRLERHRQRHRGLGPLDALDQVPLAGHELHFPLQSVAGSSLSWQVPEAGRRPRPGSDGWLLEGEHRGVPSSMRSPTYTRMQLPLSPVVVEQRRGAGGAGRDRAARGRGTRAGAGPGRAARSRRRGRPRRAGCGG